MTCEFCKLSDEKQLHSGVDVLCVGCCARLILRSKREPEETSQLINFAASLRAKGYPVPTKEQIADEVKRLKSLGKSFV